MYIQVTQNHYCADFKTEMIINYSLNVNHMNQKTVMINLTSWYVTLLTGS